MAILSGASAQKGSFPGNPSEVKSRDGRYVIRNSDSLTDSPAHSLTLVDTKGGSATTIYRYARGADVLWSPASDAFVINDYEGSNSTRPVLYRVPWTGNKSDLLEELNQFLRARREEKIVIGNHHLYFSALRWLNGNEILCQLTGYGDVNPKGFTKRYVYKLGGTFRPYR